MTSFACRLLERTGPHVRLQIFAGPDEQHRALVGVLTMTPEEAGDFALCYPMAEARP
jgi:hypothetical protein